jgi:hypothetical protein
VRGDGSLANFPASTGGGGSLSFYLNGSVSQGTFGGVAFREMDRTPIIGAGTDFTIATNGYIQSFITDANVPNQLEIPAGNWNFETYFSASSNGGSPSYYIELYKWDGATLSLIASSSANPEGITNGTATHLYVSALAVPQTALTVTDRLAVRIYVNNSGRTIKLHTENSHLCQVITTFSTGLTALNGLTAQVQNFATGTTGTDFGISSATSTHTFNLPTASAANRGALSSADWTTFNAKQAALVSGTNIKTINGASVLGSGDLVVGGSTTLAVGTTPITSGTVGRVLFQGTGNVLQQSTNLFWDNTTGAFNVIGLVNAKSTAAQTSSLIVEGTTGVNSGNAGFKLKTSAGYQPTFFAADNLAGQGTAGIGIYSTIHIPFGVQTGAPSGSLFIHSNGNVGIGTNYTNAGFKLDVNGTARVSGELTLNSSIRSTQGANLNMILGTFALQLSSGNGQNTNGTLITTGDITRTDSGTKNVINVNNLVSSTAASFNVLNGYAFTSNITQTQGTIRGLLIAPTLTASTDFRAIEITAGISILAPSRTQNASLRIPSGTAPTSPVNGDIWFDGTNLNVRIGGVTRTIVVL